MVTDSKWASGGNVILIKVIFGANLPLLSGIASGSHPSGGVTDMWSKRPASAGYRCGVTVGSAVQAQSQSPLLRCEREERKFIQRASGLAKLGKQALSRA
jgi:hypothetical protein